MPDEVRYNQELKIIEVESYGDVTRDDILGSIEKIKRIQTDTGVDKLLVDTTRQEKLPDSVDIFEIFSAYPRTIKTALLLNPTQATAEDVEFVETVALNRGKKMKALDDRERALQWLAAPD